MASKGSDEDSSEIISIKCCVCVENNVTQKADKYCVECQDYYCVPCSHQHKKFPLMRGHTLLDKWDFSSGNQPPLLPSFPTERCRVHKAKLLDLYCKSHDKVICATCFAVKHRACEDIHSIPDEIDCLHDESARGKTKEKLDAAKKEAKEIKENREELLKKLQENREKTVNDIHEFRREIEDELKKLETESLAEVDEQCEKIESDLKSDIREVNKFIVDLDQSVSKLATSGENKAQEFVCFKTAERCFRSMGESGFEKQGSVHVKFQAGLEIRDQIKSRLTLGKVRVYKPRTTVYTVKQHRDINIKLGEDASKCRIFYSCLIGDDTLLLADWENQKLMRFSISTNSLKDYLNVEANPIAVCLISTQEAVVSLNNSTIPFVSLEDKMAVTRTLKMDHICYGLAYHDGKLYISDQSSSVYIYYVNGTMLSKITSGKSGNPIFSNTRHVSLGTIADTVYVADYEKGLVTIDTQGNHLPTITDTDIASVQGICTDGRGNLIVCDLKRSKIVQFDEKSKTKLGVLGSVESPLSVCFDPNNNCLYVTCGNSDSIKIFDLL